MENIVGWGVLENGEAAERHACGDDQIDVERRSFTKKSGGIQESPVSYKN